jgi:hypothetical protein
MSRFVSVIIPVIFLLAGILAWAGEEKESKMKNDERYSLYKSKCRSCHTLVKPEKYDDQRWEEIISRYRWRARLKEDEAKKILSFLQEYN